jgi:hypothetical protein
MKIAPRDNWGDVRVPRLEALEKSSNGNHGAWITVPHITQPEQFSSLVGVPVVGIPTSSANMTADFSIETSYMSLNCSAWDIFEESDARLERYVNLWRFADPLRIRKSDLDRDFVFGSRAHKPNRTGGIDGTFFLDVVAPSYGKRDAAAALRDRRSRRLFFASARRTAGTDEVMLSATKCVITESHVEVRVRCERGGKGGSGGCRATALRRSLTDTRPEYVTPLDQRGFVTHLIRAMPMSYSTLGRFSSPTERFLHDSAMPAFAAGFVNLAEVLPRIFADRLALMLNTWYMLSRANVNSVFMSGDPTNISTYGFDFGAQMPANGSVPQSVVNESCRIMCTRSAQATLTRSIEVFSYSRLWLALLFGSSAVLFATGLAGAAISMRTRMPDMLGYVASMTYNNQFLPLPEDGGMLDAMHRTRILHDLRVSISDVESSGDVGRIAFTSNTPVHALEKGRKYV